MKAPRQNITTYLCPSCNLEEVVYESDDGLGDDLLGDSLQIVLCHSCYEAESEGEL